MAKNARRQTFADLVQETTWSETEPARGGRYATRPGGINAAGEFFDPNGRKLIPQQEDVSPEEAQRLVEADDLVIAEDCGCGGWFGGCTPEWLTREQLRGLRIGPVPRFTGRHGAPTWIDAWATDAYTVIFAHGDVFWGGALK